MFDAVNEKNQAVAAANINRQIKEIKMIMMAVESVVSIRVLEILGAFATMYNNILGGE